MTQYEYRINNQRIVLPRGRFMVQREFDQIPLTDRHGDLSVFVLGPTGFPCPDNNMAVRRCLSEVCFALEKGPVHFHIYCRKGPVLSDPWASESYWAPPLRLEALRLVSERKKTLRARRGTKIGSGACGVRRRSSAFTPNPLDNVFSCLGGEAIFGMQFKVALPHGPIEDRQVELITAVLARGNLLAAASLSVIVNRLVL